MKTSTKNKLKKTIGILLIVITLIGLSFADKDLAGMIMLALILIAFSGLILLIAWLLK